MKKICALLAAAALLLAACNSNPAGNSSSSGSSSQSSQESSQSSSQVEELSAQEWMDPAMEAYGWFMLGTISYDGNVVHEEEGQYPYYLVTDPRFPTYEAFYDYLTSIFSKDIVDNTLLASNTFCAFDGKLYTVGAARGSNIFIGNVTYEITSETDTQRQITASVKYLVDPSAQEPEVEKTEAYTFVQEKEGDHWVFIEFPYFY